MPREALTGGKDRTKTNKGWIRLLTLGWAQHSHGSTLTIGASEWICMSYCCVAAFPVGAVPVPQLVTNLLYTTTADESYATLTINATKYTNIKNHLCSFRQQAWKSIEYDRRWILCQNIPYSFLILLVFRECIWNKRTLPQARMKSKYHVNWWICVLQASRLLVVQGCCRI